MTAGPAAPAPPARPAGRVEVRPFEPADARGVARLARTVPWPSVADAGVVERVCAAPGSVAFVATAGDDLVGWAQALGDGVLQSHLSFLVVRADHRRRGIGRLLVVATFQATATARIDLITDGAAEEFYTGFAHRRMSGFRLYPGADES